MAKVHGDGGDRDKLIPKHKNLAPKESPKREVQRKVQNAKGDKAVEKRRRHSAAREQTKTINKLADALIEIARANGRPGHLDDKGLTHQRYTAEVGPPDARRPYPISSATYNSEDPYAVPEVSTYGEVYRTDRRPYPGFLGEGNTPGPEASLDIEDGRIYGSMSTPTVNAFGYAPVPSREQAAMALSPLLLKMLGMA
jgi:hypothetical protein